MQARLTGALLLVALAAAASIVAAGCGGGGDADSGSGTIDTGLGFSIDVDSSAPGEQQVKQFAQGLFDRVELDPDLERCVRANAEKGDPKKLEEIAGLSGDDQADASRTFEAAFFQGCNLETGGIISDGANDETKKLVAITFRDELRDRLPSNQGDYAACVGKALDDLSDDDLIAIVENPEKAGELGGDVAEECGTPPSAG